MTETIGRPPRCSTWNCRAAAATSTLTSGSTTIAPLSVSRTRITEIEAAELVDARGELDVE